MLCIVHSEMPLFRERSSDKGARGKEVEKGAWWLWQVTWCCVENGGAKEASILTTIRSNQKGNNKETASLAVGEMVSDGESAS